MIGRVPMPARRSRAALAGWWLLALVVASALLAATHFRTRDADSRVYLTIAAHLSEVPVSRWMAPQWWGVWGMQGLYREHPIGTFVPPALLARAGFPALQAAFVVTLAAQVACLLLFVALAGRFVPDVEARALAWTLQLMPIAFVFRIRANQEYLLLAGLLVALYGVERSRDRAGWLWMALAGFLYALSVKGLFALIVPVIAIVWLVVMPARPGSRPVRGWLAVGLMLLATPVAGLLYERAYVATIGDSFLDYYLHLRLSLAGGSSSGANLPFPLDKIWNATWYAGHVAWYAAPWSLVLVAAAFTRRMWRWPDRTTRTWILFALLATVAAIAVASTRDQRSDRYTFPAYFLTGAGGTLVVASWWPRGAGWAEALDRYWPWGPVALWLALFAARLVLG
jgi:4-amino-4-deoxy-L-arabinose transferase-like glycosyltransferase